MTQRLETYYNLYLHFTDPVLEAIRKEAYGVDIGQNSWLTVDELERFIEWMRLTPESHVLEVGSGSGGPALHVARTAGCRLTGVDAHEGGVATGTELAQRAEMEDRVRFEVADAEAALPFEDESFDAILCVDSMNHFLDRPAVLREWRRVLRAGRRAVFTDPVVITGPVTKEELALRSSIGPFLFVPPGVNERLVGEAGFQLVHEEDRSENAAQVAGRRRDARQARRKDLMGIEDEAHFEGSQRFYDVVHRLAAERRLSRIAYVIERIA
jgi:SAM-dependent methyltransferase